MPSLAIAKCVAAGIAAIGIYIATHASMRLRLNDMERFIQFLEPALGSMVFIGAGVLSIWSLEARWKRRHALQALHNLRSLASGLSRKIWQKMMILTRTNP